MRRARAPRRKGCAAPGGQPPPAPRSSAARRGLGQRPGATPSSRALQLLPCGSRSVRAHARGRGAGECRIPCHVSAALPRCAPARVNVGGAPARGATAARRRDGAHAALGALYWLFALRPLPSRSSRGPRAQTWSPYDNNGGACARQLRAAVFLLTSLNLSTPRHVRGGGWGRLLHRGCGHAHEHGVQHHDARLQEDRRAVRALPLTAPAKRGLGLCQSCA